MTADDTGTVSVTIETRPGILSEQAEDMLNRAEAVVKADHNVESYMLRYSNNSGTITGYLRDDRDMSTDDVADKWKKEMADIDNCTITVEASSSMSFMRRRTDYEVILHGTQYDELKEVSDKIVKEMTDRDDVINVHSSIENTAPIVTVKVDPVMAAAEGLSASRIGSMVKQMLKRRGGHHPEGGRSGDQRDGGVSRGRVPDHRSAKGHYSQQALRRLCGAGGRGGDLL